MSLLSFTKMHGLGNDFIVVDNLSGSVSLAPERIRRLSDRHTGIGFDQLLIVEKPSIAAAEFDYRIYNADGAEVEHCGNGARCFARFVHEKGLTDNRTIAVNTAGGLIELQLRDDGDVTVQMGVPNFIPDKVPFLADSESLYYDMDVDGRTVKVGVASIGNPHVLLSVDDIDTADVATLGPQLESHARFPRRVNVNFMQIIDRGSIRLRVFERGVGETRACGSGACATVAIAHRQGLLDDRVVVELPGGKLDIYWPDASASVEMTGPCSTVFEGQTRM